MVKTLYGRRRLVPELTSRNGQIRSAAERVAVNLPIQGTAADIMKRAMIDVHQALAPHADARMILTVHDELLFEVPKERANDLAAIVREAMEGAATLKVVLHCQQRNIFPGALSATCRRALHEGHATTMAMIVLALARAGHGPVGPDDGFLETMSSSSWSWYWRNACERPPKMYRYR